MRYNPQMDQIFKGGSMLFLMVLITQSASGYNSWTTDVFSLCMLLLGLDYAHYFGFLSVTAVAISAMELKPSFTQVCQQIPMSS